MRVFAVRSVAVNKSLYLGKHALFYFKIIFPSKIPVDATRSLSLVSSTAQDTN